MTSATPAPQAENAQEAAPRPLRICAECGEGFVPRRPQQQFCKPAHKTKFQNRSAADGRAIIALAKAWRISRNSAANRDLGARCMSQMSAILDAMNERDRKANRSTEMTLAYAKVLLDSGMDWRDRADCLPTRTTRLA